ncbi:MAG: hypothetical protein Kow00106_19230 [Anaerolineae bacterium]
MLNDSFCYQAGELCCDGLPLRMIADAVGTPVYVYSAARLRHNVARLQRALAPLEAELHYSLKANPNLTLVRMLSQAGLGADAVSAGEIDRALRAGVDPACIVFAGVGKTPAEITYALRAKIGWFNVESRDELTLLDRLAGEERCRPQVALRLNPGLHAQTHPHIATGHAAAKFGMPPQTVADVLRARTAYTHRSSCAYRQSAWLGDGDGGGGAAGAVARRAVPRRADDQHGWRLPRALHAR